MLFALGFLPMFGIGGLTGLPLGLSSSDIHLHDTLYVIGHFHYVVAPGTLFALFAGIYYWFPKASGRMMNETLGKLHFWGSLIFMNLIFFPMLIQGMAGINRRLHDGGASYADATAIIEPGFYSHVANYLYLNKWMSMSAWALGLVQIFFLVNLFWSLKKGKKAERNPWNATTVEWAAPSPPGHGNFDSAVEVYHGPYEYSVPGASKDFSPQFEKGPST
jgi:cytochrome c oxidase subunit 1